jgi:transcription initiation factor TFIIIB Brf1 subunit/transcription initiation factor TFIIB
LTSVAGSQEAVVCSECNRVDPEPSDPDTYESQRSGDNDGDNIEDTDTQPITDDWKHSVAVTDSSDENIVEILSLVDTYVEATSLPQEVRLRAAEMLVSAWEDGLFAGRRKEPLTAAGVYAAGRECREPRPLTTISNTAKVNESKLNDAYRLLISEFDLEIPITGPEDYAPYLGHELSLPESLIREAVVILEEEVDCSGNPAGIAASVLYLLGSDDFDITLKQAGSTAGVSKETVWRKTRDLRSSGIEVG